MEVTIHLIRATENDVPLIRQIAFNTWFETYGSILSQEQMDYMFEWMYSENSLHNQIQKGHVFYLAYEGTNALGYVSIEQQNANLFHLQKIYVTPGAQGKGIGKILLNRAFDHAKSVSNDKPCTVELNVNRHNKAFHFYQRMGMRIHAQGDFDIGNGYFMNDYILRIEL